MSTDSHGTGEQPTAPIPRSGRHDDPTQIFETFGERQDPARTEALPTDQPPTQALPTDQPPTQALPTDQPPTQALPTDQPPTQALPTEPPQLTRASADPAPTQGPPAGRVSAFGADPSTGRPAPRLTGPGGDHATAGSGGTGGSTPVPTAGAADRGPAAAAPTPTTTERAISRTLRVGTVVWGLIIAIIGAGLVSVAAGARFDMELVLIGLLALAGVALVAGSLAVSMRRRH